MNSQLNYIVARTAKLLALINPLLLRGKPSNDEDNDFDHFGRCPKCRNHQTYELVNVGRMQWFICRTHHVRWCIGENMFRCWRDETPEEWARNKAQLTRYKEVCPYRKE